MLNKPEHFAVGWVPPFQLSSPYIQLVPEGASLGDLLDIIPGIPENFREQGFITIGGHEVPSALWWAVRPKADNIVTMQYALQGSRRTRKAVFGLIAAIGLTIITAGIAGGSMSGWLGAGFAKGTLGAKLLAGVVSVAGSALIGKLTASPINMDIDNNAAKALTASSASGNVLDPNAAIPFVMGVRRVFPNFYNEPLVMRNGQTEYVLTGLTLADRHEIYDLSVNGRRIDVWGNNQDDAINVFGPQYNNNTSAVGLRQSRTIEMGEQMSYFETRDGDDPQNWVDPAIDPNIPQWHSIITRQSPDKVHLHLVVNALTENEDPAYTLRAPFRMRIRRIGTGQWYNLPEMHLKARTSGGLRVTFNLIWEDFDPVGAAKLPNPNVEGLNVFPVFWGRTPAYTVITPEEEWLAHTIFMNYSSGKTDNYWTPSNAATSRIRNIVNLWRAQMNIFLPTSLLPKGQYEIQVKVGSSARHTHILDYAYTHTQFGANVVPLFNRFTWSGNANRIAFATNERYANFTIQRVVNWWDENPVGPDGVRNTRIEVRGKNTTMGATSVTAAGYSRCLGIADSQPAGAGNVPTMTSGTTFARVSVNNETNVIIGIPWDCMHEKPTGGNQLLASVGGNAFGVTVRSVDGGRKLRFTVGAATNGTEWSTTNMARVDVGVNLFTRRANNTHPMLLLNIRLGIGTMDIYYDDVYYGTARTVDNTSLPRWSSLTNHFVTLMTSATDLVTAQFPITSAVNRWRNRSIDAAPKSASDVRIWISGILNVDNNTWNLFRPSKNPADWYRMILVVTDLSNDALPTSMVDMEGLASWRDACIRNNWSIDFINENISVEDLLKLVASCGYASPYQSEIWGVVRDYDRSNEAPEIVISPKNASDFSWSKSWAKMPAGLKITFPNEELNYEDDQILLTSIFDDAAPITESLNYEGTTDTLSVLYRAMYDQCQIKFRATTYSLRVPQLWLGARRGSLVAVAYDSIANAYGSGHILGFKTYTGGANLEEIYIDDNISVDPDIIDPDDMIFQQHEGDVIQNASNNLYLHVINLQGDSIRSIPLQGPVDGDVLKVSGTVSAAGFNNFVGSMAIIGTLEKAYKRLIITDIAPEEELSATLTLVDEAPEIWSTIRDWLNAQ